MIKRLFQVIAFPLITFIWIGPVAIICIFIGIIYFPLKYIITGNSSYEDNEEKLMDLIFYPFEKLLPND